MVVKALLILPDQAESWASVKEVSNFCKDKYLSIYPELDIYYVIRDEVFKKSKSFLQYNIIINLDHSVETLKALAFVKSIVGENCLIHFYALGMASSFYWPLIKWGLAKNLNSKDRFIVSCHRDANITKKCFPNSSIEVIPFELEVNSVVINDEEDINIEYVVYY